MKSSISVLFVLGLILAVSSAESHDDFNILTPEGTYKHGNSEIQYTLNEPIFGKKMIINKLSNVIRINGNVVSDFGSHN